MEIKIIRRETESVFPYQAWPTVAKMDDGTLVAACSGHRLGHICPFGKNLMYQSRDGGKTWSAPQIINDTPLDDRDAGLLTWGDNILLTWFNHAASRFEEWAKEDRSHIFAKTPLALGMRALWDTLPEDRLKAGSFTRISRDGGKTWSAPRPAPVTSPHGPCRFPDGTLLYVGSRVSADGNFHGFSGSERIQAFVSHDDGETWEFRSVLPYPSDAKGSIHEPHAAYLGDGIVLAAVRHQGPDKPIMKGLKMYLALSRDFGKTWEEAKFLPFDGSPPHLLPLGDGKVMLTWSKRRDPMGQYAALSTDFGKTWSKELFLAPANQPDWDHGYPSTVLLSDTEFLTVYYGKAPGDDFTSLFFTTFSLSDFET